MCGCLRMSYYASWQNSANMGSLANLAITTRTAFKFRARSRSQSEHIFDLDRISWVISEILEPWLECHCAFGGTISYLKLFQISLHVIPQTVFRLRGSGGLSLGGVSAGPVQGVSLPTFVRRLRERWGSRRSRQRETVGRATFDDPHSHIWYSLRSFILICRSYMFEIYNVICIFDIYICI